MTNCVAYCSNFSLFGKYKTAGYSSLGMDKASFGQYTNDFDQIVPGDSEFSSDLIGGKRAVRLLRQAH